jgi:uncharacterized membrane protein SpoIIM required for sporulation
MKEVVFLKVNAEKWKRFEQLLQAPRGTDPDQLADLFVQVTDDLSYAKTFYPNSKTTQYLNGLAAEVHRAIYRNRKEDRRRFVSFWTHELPQVMAGARTELLVAFLVFAFSVLVGVLSAAGDGTFARLILGDAYVNMTLANIEKGDPMAVYKQMQALDMFLAITFNNVRVAFLAFAAGLLASFGTGFILFQNGVMLGVFHTLFHAHRLLGPSLLVVYIHGALEISAIVIAGAAGLVMGNSILFPGTYTRGQSFLNGARRGLKIVVGLVPIFVVAGFLEGFVTRHTDMPLALSLAIIVGSLGFILWYFVLYPFRWKQPSPSASGGTSATS